MKLLGSILNSMTPTSNARESYTFRILCTTHTTTTSQPKYVSNKIALVNNITSCATHDRWINATMRARHDQPHTTLRN